MEALFDSLYPWSSRIHIALGFAGLLVFWVAIFSRKGGRVHIASGKLFMVCLYGVVGLATLSCIYRFIKPFARGGPPEGSTPEQLAQAAAYVRTLYIFLFYLGVITFASARHGIRVAQTRRDPQALRTPWHYALARSSIVMSVVVVAAALNTASNLRVVLLAMSPIGIIVGKGMLNFLREPRPTPMAWWYEHMGAMIGTGIGFHTAFLVFGAQRFIDIPSGALWGFGPVLPWILPALIGMPANHLWVRYYQRKFGEMPEGKTPVNPA